MNEKTVYKLLEENKKLENKNRNLLIMCDVSLDAFRHIFLNNLVPDFEIDTKTIIAELEEAIEKNK